jgi:hypothetical protein
MADQQLTIDGLEVPADGVVLRGGPLSPTQQDVLRWLRETGTIRPRDAGLLLYRNQRQTWRDEYASADGAEVLRRLAIRGLVHKQRRGVWVLGPGPPPPLRRNELERRRR